MGGSGQGPGAGVRGREWGQGVGRGRGRGGAGGKVVWLLIWYFRESVSEFGFQIFHFNGKNTGMHICQFLAAVIE